MSKKADNEILAHLKTILQNIDNLEKNFDEQFQRIDEKFEKVDLQFHRLNTSITLIGGDVDQLKQRVARIERHLNISGNIVGN